MGQLWKDILAAVVLGMVVPGVLMNGAVLYLEGIPEEASEPKRQDSGWNVRVRTGAEVTEMDSERYVMGVVLAEMPADFEPEALKAQSVAARTYARKAHVTGGKHGDGSVCTDSTCCQGYLSEDVFQSRGGTQEAVDKVAEAVLDTQSMVLTYGQELIEATYFSCSGGSTEDAVAVWGVEFPYLQSVASPGEETDSAQTLRFTPEEFQKALGRELPGRPSDWFTVTTYTAGGGVASMTVCGERYTGTRLRSLLGLRSTVFSVAAGTSEIAITTRGYGHRVGMSQYGAEAMAVSGSSFREILSHYYPGTVLTRLGIDEFEEIRYD